MSTYQPIYVGNTYDFWEIPLTAGTRIDDISNVDITKFTMVFQPTNTTGAQDRTGTGTFYMKDAATIYYKPSVADVASSFNGNLVIQAFFPPSGTNADEVVYDPIPFVISPR